MIAYVFWHWPRQPEDAAGYKRRIARFHRALRADSPRGFHGSRTFVVTGVPGLNRPGEVLEDWYFVDDFGDLGLLNKTAVAPGARTEHDEAARDSGGGTGGVYALRSTRVVAPTRAVWFSKPEGVTYASLFAGIPPGLELWQRQLVLGPAPEFCALASKAGGFGAWAAAIAGLTRVTLDTLMF